MFMPESDVLAVNMKSLGVSHFLPPTACSGTDSGQGALFSGSNLIEITKGVGSQKQFREWRKVNNLIAWCPVVENERCSASSKLS